LATAKQIFEIAKANGTPFFSSSALRYAEELETPYDCLEIITTGGGSNLPEYIVHQAEIVVKKLGGGAERIKAETYGSKTYLHVTYPDERSAAMIYAPKLPFTVSMWGGEGTKNISGEIRSSYFVKLIEEGDVAALKQNKQYAGHGKGDPIGNFQTMWLQAEGMSVYYAWGSVGEAYVYMHIVDTTGQTMEEVLTPMLNAISAPRAE
jgi:hypothetical protein